METCCLNLSTLTCYHRVPSHHPAGLPHLNPCDQHVGDPHSMLAQRLDIQILGSCNARRPMFCAQHSRGACSSDGHVLPASTLAALLTLQRQVILYNVLLPAGCNHIKEWLVRGRPEQQPPSLRLCTGSTALAAGGSALAAGKGAA